MENITQIFNTAKAEFKKSNASEQSVEQLYDLIYLLQKQNRNFEEDYILAQLYTLVGNRSAAIEVIKSGEIPANKNEAAQLEKLLSDLEKNIYNVKLYKDLREAKLVKPATQLYLDDILIPGQGEDDYFKITISDTVKYIVVANKNLENNDHNLAIFVSNTLQKSIESDWVYKLISQIEWLGKIENDLIDFYNRSDFDNKMENVGKRWFDGLDIMDVSIYIENDETIVTDITFSDYFLSDIGISFSLKDQAIVYVEYGC